MAIGVPYGLFGKLNPKKLEPFRDAFNITQDEIRFNLWLQGLYFKMAAVSAFNSESPYPDKPLDLTANKGSDCTKQVISETANKAIRFSAWADAYNEKLSQQKQTEGQ